MACIDVQQQVEQHLVDLIAVVFHFRQPIGSFFSSILIGLESSLLARQHDRVLHRGIQVARSIPGVRRARRLQQIGKDVVDLRDFQANIFHDGARRTAAGQVASNDFDDAGNAGQRIANFMRQPGGEFAEGGQDARRATSGCGCSR